MKKRIILIGPSGSGKDHLYAELLREGYAPAVSYTTRPPRGGEIEGETYHYISKDEFESKINAGLFFEYTQFTGLGWYYGTTKEDFNTKNLFIQNPNGIINIPKDELDKSLVIYLNPPEDIRRERIGNRIGNVDDIDRRIEGDDIDFDKVFHYDILITDPFFTLESIYIELSKFESYE